MYILAARWASDASIALPRHCLRLSVVSRTDKASEEAVLKIIMAEFPDHAVLGEEGGVFGNTSSEYLWRAAPRERLGSVRLPEARADPPSHVLHLPAQVRRSARRHNELRPPVPLLRGVGTRLQARRRAFLLLPTLVCES